LAKSWRNAGWLRSLKPPEVMIPGVIGGVGNFAEGAAKSSPASGARAAT
jgi:hypothetical protein